MQSRVCVSDPSGGSLIVFSNYPFILIVSETGGTMHGFQANFS